MSKPRVALIEPVGSHGGMDYYDSGLAGAISKQGGYVKWYTCQESKICGDALFKLEPTFVGIWGGDAAWLRGLRYIKGLFKSLFDARLNNINIVHYHLFHVGVLELLGVALAKAFFFKVVLTVHDVESFRPGLHSGFLRNFTYFLSSAVIVHNVVSKAELLRINPEIEPKTYVIPHGSYIGLTTPRMPKVVARQKLMLPLDEKVILFFGQIKEVKGLDLLIEAFAKAITNISPVKLVIAGKVWKDDFSKYQSLINDYQIKNNIHLEIRYIPDEEISAFYSCADLIVLPYRKIYQSGVLLMAMSYGVPVLASDLPGMKEIVQDEVNGYLFEAGNAESLALKLVEVFNAEKSLSVIVDNANKDMETSFSWNEIALKTLVTYKKILS